MPNENKIKGAVLISGTSRGIGRACALLLYKHGYKVFAGVRREEDAVALREISSDNLIPVMLEITDADSIRQAAGQISDITGDSGLYGLVNNAGVAVAGPLEFMPLQRIREQFEVNVIGQMGVTQALMPLLRRGQGRVVNISSKEGIIAMPFVGPYCASKFALEALSDALRMELKPWGIPVSIIEPGTISTEIIQRSIAAAEDCVRALPRDAEEMYQSCFDKARKASDKIASAAISVDNVAKTVLKVLNTAKPRPRYTVGSDARILALISRILPDRLLDRLILKQIGLD
jgi:NAD(P)-dependent dehydrogenase (short-subunit alcohol dehydrogenase family)